MPELTWGEPEWLTEEEFAASMSGPVEVAFWQLFTSWRPGRDHGEVADVEA